MLCRELETLWPERWPRPDADNTVHNKRMIVGFCREFAEREPSSIARSEARNWALANPSHARYVRTMFNDLLDDGLIKENAFAGIRLPTEVKKAVFVPSAEEVEALLAAATVQMKTKIEFAAEVGLRIGEQQAVMAPSSPLTGNVLTQDRRRLSIDWQFSRKRKLKKPKTESSQGVVMVSKRARRAVEVALTYQRRHKGKLHGSGRLWHQPLSHHETEFSALRREVGVWFKWHALRHYCATAMLNAGATVDDVATQLRCSEREIRDTYGRPDRELALRRLEEVTGA